jgi:hypothetical protein
VFENKWSRFKGEFQHQSEATRIIGFIFVWVSLVLIVLAVEWAGSIAIKLLDLADVVHGLRPDQRPVTHPRLMHMVTSVLLFAAGCGLSAWRMRTSTSGPFV